MGWWANAKDIVTTIAILVGGVWAVWKWGYGEKLRKRREMCSPDGALTASTVPIDAEKLALTLTAVWRNRGELPIELCPVHSRVQVFMIKRDVPFGMFKLQESDHVSEIARSEPSWTSYVMEPNTDSVMHEHFTIQSGSPWFSMGYLYGSRFTTRQILRATLKCSRELIWYSGKVDAQAATETLSQPNS